MGLVSTAGVMITVVVAAAVKTVDNMTSSSHMFYFLNSVIKKLNIY